MDEQQPAEAGEPEPEPERPETGPLAQLQSIIEDLARQSEPTVREIAAKAAELAAVAGRKAGPLAQRAAEVTGSVGEKVANRGTEMAADLRRGRTGPEGSEPLSGPADAADSAGRAAGERGPDQPWTPPADGDSPAR
jgi:hypothetical protein